MAGTPTAPKQISHVTQTINTQSKALNPLQTEARCSGRFNGTEEESESAYVEEIEDGGELPHAA